MTLEGDGDQVLMECRSNPEPDPAVFYYDHGAGIDTARKLAASFSA